MLVPRRFAARGPAQSAPRSSSADGAARRPRRGRGGGDSAGGAAPGRDLARARRLALRVRRRGAPALRSATRGARRSRARALRSPRRARSPRSSGASRSACAHGRPTSSAHSERSRAQVTALEQHQEQRIAEVEARLEAEAAELGTTVDQQRAPAIRLREELESSAKEALARGARRAADPGRRPAPGDRRDRRSPPPARAGDERADRPRGERGACAGSRSRSPSSSDARSSSSTARSTREVDRLSEAGALEFENRMRAIREEAAGRLREELDRMSESFLRRANGLIADQFQQVVDDASQRLDDRIDEARAALRGAAHDRQRLTRRIDERQLRAGRERLSRQRRDDAAWPRRPRPTALERERAGEGRELAPAHPARGRLPGSPRRAARRERGRPPRRRRDPDARLRSDHRRRDPLVARPARPRRDTAWREGRADPLRRPQGLHGLGVQPRHRALPRRLPAVWVEGEVTELRRNEAWANVFLTLKDPKTGATLNVTIARRAFDRLELELEEGETVHVAGPRGALRARRASSACARRRSSASGSASTSLALEQLKRKLAAEGLFARERKRPLPRVPRAVGILTGADAAARGDLVDDDRRALPGGEGRRLRDARPGQGRAGGDRRGARARSQRTRRSTSSCSRAAAAASRISSRSATRRSSARSRRARSRSSRRSATSRTRRSATSPPTPALRRRPRPARSSSRTSPSCASALDALAAAARARRPRPARARRAAARATAASGCARRRACCSSDAASALDHSGARLQALSPRATLARGYAIVRARRRARCATPPTVQPGRPPRDRARVGRARRTRRGGAAVSDERPFEELQRELEEIVTRLERGDVPVDDAIALFRRGEELYSACVAAARRVPSSGSRSSRARRAEARDTRQRGSCMNRPMAKPTPDLLRNVRLFSDLDERISRASPTSSTSGASRPATRSRSRARAGSCSSWSRAARRPSRCTARPSRTLGPGAAFGEIALIDRRPRTATVTAATDLTCYGLPVFVFRPFVEARPQVAWKLLEAMADRLAGRRVPLARLAPRATTRSPELDEVVLSRLLRGSPESATVSAPANVRLDAPAEDDAADARRGARARDLARRLALRRRRVDVPLAGDDEVAAARGARRSRRGRAPPARPARARRRARRAPRRARRRRPSRAARRTARAPPSRRAALELGDGLRRRALLRAEEPRRVARGVVRTSQSDRRRNGQLAQRPRAARAAVHRRACRRAPTTSDAGASRERRDARARRARGSTRAADRAPRRRAAAARSPRPPRRPRARPGARASAPRPAGRADPTTIGLAPLAAERRAASTSAVPSPPSATGSSSASAPALAKPRGRAPRRPPAPRGRP